MSFKRVLSIMLAVLILSFSACSEAAREDPETPAGTDQESAPTDVPAETDAKQDRASVPDDLPDLDFGGRDFRAAQQTSRTCRGEYRGIHPADPSGARQYDYVRTACGLRLHRS